MCEAGDEAPHAVRRKANGASWYSFRSGSLPLSVDRSNSISPSVAHCALDAAAPQRPVPWPRQQLTLFVKEKMERVMGIEPTYSAWKAAALPLSYTRISGLFW